MEVKPLLAVLALVSLTGAELAALASARPFTRISTGLDWAFGAAPNWTQVTALLRDPEIMETSVGENPLESFHRLEQNWSRHPGVPRVAFLGNSQMQAVSLAPGEAPPSGLEATYVDQVALRLRSAERPVLVYRISAGGFTYLEALWCAVALTANPLRKPDVLVMQLNYQAFWLSGIRPGIVNLAGDPDVRAALELEAAADTTYAPLFRSALSEFANREAEHAPKSPAATSLAGRGFGSILESKTREAMTAWPAFRERHETKDEFLSLLYRLRLYVLRLKPSTARSITGTRLERSRQCLEALAALCAREKIRLVLFQAPLNPQVRLYGTDADRLSYHEYVEDFSKRHRVPVYDFEDAIPAELWGRWFNGPDPLHLGRAAHQQLAGRMEQVVRESVESR
jgi:hypothetical protein